jgi:WD40 repeat protein
VAFDPHKNFLATGSMDQTCKLWDLETGKEHSTLKGHEGEIVSLNFNNDGDKILTGSFDGTAIVLLFLIDRFGTPELENQSIFCKATLDKFPALNLSSVATFVAHRQLIKHADFGMWVQENV